MTVTVEARGVLCPVPIIRLARAVADLPAGATVVLLTDDPAAEHDVPAWCRLRGHSLLDMSPVGETAAASGRESQGVHPAGPEPEAPNHAPGQALRHLIRVGPIAATG